MSIVHGVGDVKSVQCNICASSFQSNTGLKTHLANVHGVVDSDVNSVNVEQSDNQLIEVKQEQSDDDRDDAPSDGDGQLVLQE